MQPKKSNHTECKSRHGANDGKETTCGRETIFELRRARRFSDHPKRISQPPLLHPRLEKARESGGMQGMEFHRKFMEYVIAIDSV
jgi:hypothetical protein